MATSSGIFIAIEGIDGAGKTTQVKMLTDLLRAAGESVVASKEPTDGVWGRKLRESASTGRLPLSDELDLFTKDRKEHLDKVIVPALAAGKVVILDRYFYSTIAYQGSRGTDWRHVEQMMSFAPVPDMVFLLDADPLVTLHRISHGRNERPNEFEQEQSLALCRSIFLKLAAERSEVKIIDAAQTVKQISQAIVQLMLDNAFLHARCAKKDGCDFMYCSFRQSGTCDWATLQSKIFRAAQKVEG